MEQNRCLGIYVEADKATVVLAAKTGGQIEIAEQFCVPIAEQQPFSFAQAAKDIAAACQEKQLAFTDIAVALDCRFYRQQTLHSEFTEPKQIAQTVKFDAEESLAINAAEAAVSFEIASRGLSGSEVSVFAVQAAIMSEIILSLQNNKLDPVIVEPDSVCLRRILQLVSGPDGSKPIWAALSENKCFIISPPPLGSEGSPQSGNSAVRAFLSRGSNRSNSLAREIIFTAASNAAAEEADKIKVLDFQSAVDLALLSQQTGKEAEIFDPSEVIISKAQENNCGKLDVIIAAGAAAGVLGKAEKVDFRPFFLPFQGKKEAFEKTVKLASISFAILFIALGAFFYVQYFKINRYSSRLMKKFRSEYAIAMTGARFNRSSEAVRGLKSEINRIKDVKNGILSATGEDSVEAKLAYFFEALNSVPPGVDIEIEKITINAGSMVVSGNTSSRGYLEVFAAVDRHPKLKRGSSTYQAKENRDYFRISIETKQ